VQGSNTRQENPNPSQEFINDSQEQVINGVTYPAVDTLNGKAFTTIFKAFYVVAY